MEGKEGGRAHRALGGLLPGSRGRESPHLNPQRFYHLPAAPLGWGLQHVALGGQREPQQPSDLSPGARLPQVWPWPWDGLLRRTPVGCKLARQPSGHGEGHEAGARPRALWDTERQPGRGQREWPGHAFRPCCGRPAPGRHLSPLGHHACGCPQQDPLPSPRACVCQGHARPGAEGALSLGLMGEGRVPLEPLLGGPHPTTGSTLMTQSPGKAPADSTTLRVGSQPVGDTVRTPVRDAAGRRSPRPQP